MKEKYSETKSIPTTLVMFNIFPSLVRWGELINHPIDPKEIRPALDDLISAQTFDPRMQLIHLSNYVGIESVRWCNLPQPHSLPMLVFDETLGWCVLTSLTIRGDWMYQQWSIKKHCWEEVALMIDPSKQYYASLTLASPWTIPHQPSWERLWDYAQKQHWSRFRKVVRLVLICTMASMFLYALTQLINHVDEYIKLHWVRPN